MATSASMFQFTAVDVHLVEAVDLPKPSFSALVRAKDPYVMVTAGPNKWKSPSAIGTGSSAKFGSSITLPFEGILRLRFSVFDRKDREIGFHDFNLRKIDPQNPSFTGKVQLGNAKGPAGELSIEILCHTRTVQSPSKSSPSSDVPCLSPPLPFKGIRVEVGKIRDMKCNESFYVVAEYENQIIRARPKAKDQQKDFLKTNDFKTVFVLPFTNQRYLRVFVYEYSRLMDKLRGSTLLDLEALRSKPTFRGLFDLTSQHGKEGNLEITISLLEADIVIPVVHQGDEQLQVEETLQKQIAQHGYQIHSVKVHCKQITDVPMPESVTRINPYVRCRIGGISLSSDPIPKATGTCLIHSDFLFPFHHERYVYIDVMHRKRLRHDQPLGTTRIDLLPLLSHIDHETSFTLPLTPTEVTNHGRSEGTIQLVIIPSRTEQKEPTVKSLTNDIMEWNVETDGSDESYSVAEEMKSYKQLEITVDTVSGLLDPQRAGSMDPYVVCKLAVYELKSSVRADAGTSANIRSLFVFPYTGERKLRVDVYDRERLRSDRKIGTAMVDLHELRDKKGAVDIQLVGVRGKLSGQPAGIVTLQGSFLKAQTGDAHVLDLIDGKILLTRRSSLSSLSSTEGELPLQPTQYRSLELHIHGFQSTTTTKSTATNGGYFKVICGHVALKSGMISNAKNLIVSELFTFPYHGEQTMKIVRIEKGRVRSTSMGTCVLRLRDFFNTRGLQKASTLDASGRPLDEISFDISFSPIVKASRIKSMSGGDDESSHGRTRLTTRPPYKAVFVTLVDFEGRLGRPTGLKIKMGLDGSAIATACGPQDSVRFGFPWEGGRRLRLAAYEKHTLSGEELLGTGKVDLQQLIGKREHNLPVQLEGPVGFVTAHVKIELSEELILAPFVVRQ